MTEFRAIRPGMKRGPKSGATDDDPLTTKPEGLVQWLTKT